MKKTLLILALCLSGCVGEIDGLKQQAEKVCKHFGAQDRGACVEFLLTTECADPDTPYGQLYDCFMNELEMNDQKGRLPGTLEYCEQAPGPDACQDEQREWYLEHFDYECGVDRMMYLDCVCFSNQECDSLWLSWYLCGGLDKWDWETQW